MKGMVFDIQKFSLHDGPGIRTTVFLKGCPLRCVWCHNPESWSGRKEILYSAEKCVSCGNCIAQCQQQCHAMEEKEHIFSRKNCVSCGNCTEKCYSGALTLCGNEMSVEGVMEQVLKDRIFYENSGGGMTISGGEPMSQFAFTQELLQRGKNAGIHTAVETCGFAPEEHYSRLIGLADLFLFDIKSVDSAKHREFTGQDNELILKNLRFLDSAGCALRLRCPLIPGLNDGEEALRQIAELAGSLDNVQGIDVEPYHPLGVSKAARLGKKDFFSAPFAEKEQWEKWLSILRQHTDVEVIKL